MRRNAFWASAVLVVAALVPATPAGADELASFDHQQLSWSHCAGIDDPRLQCAEVAVPLDYADPGLRTIHVGISRLPATDPAHRRGVLLMTGGGPSSPGVPLPEQMRGILDPAITADYDLIGFDPRFLERSTPISCGQSHEEPGAFWVRSAKYESFAATMQESIEYAIGCARTAGWALPYATTDNVARDMDIIRAALGEPKISYLSGSYAGMLGAVYATLFPRRVDRFVLDSPSDFDLVWRKFELGRTPSFEAGWQTFASTIAVGDGTYHLGTTADQVKANVNALYARAPIAVGGRSWSFSDLGFLVLLGIFAPSLQPAVATDLHAIDTGAAPPIALPVDPVTSPGVTGVPADNHTAVNTMFRCADGNWSRNPATYLRDIATYSAKYPTYGAIDADINPCAFWPIRGGADHVKLGTDRSPGVLITGSTNDPALPIANELGTEKAVKGSRLVTMSIDAHEPFTTGVANSCMTTAVDDYLLDGRMPAHDLTC